MGYWKSILWSLLFCSAVHPAGAFSESGISASASARITLQIGPRAEIRPSDASGQTQMCLSHIPAETYSVAVTAGNGVVYPEVSGQAGQICLSAPLFESAHLITIVAE